VTFPCGVIPGVTVKRKKRVLKWFGTGQAARVGSKDRPLLTATD
jgi:hypothetical protein